jgi:hypothetical protein
MIIDFDHARTEIHPDGEIMLRTESFVGELHEETTFSHTRVTYDDVFEQKRIRHPEFLPCQRNNIIMDS